VAGERVAEVERVEAHVAVSLTELIAREDALIGRFSEEAERGVVGAAGFLAQAEVRQQELIQRRDRRQKELVQERSLSLQAVERLTSLLILPHPERESPEVRKLRPNPEVEAIAMQVAMEHERAQGRVVEDVHEKDLGYDVTSLDTVSGELRLIEVKGLGDPTGTVMLSPNEKRVSEDRRDCYWLYVVTDCFHEKKLHQVKDPALMAWHEVKKVEHYYLSVDAMGKEMKMWEHPQPFGTEM